MTATLTTLHIAEHSAAYWRVTLDNPPINMLNPDMVAEFQRLLDRIESDDRVKIVVFDSADPDFFVSHVDVLRVGENNDLGTTGLPAWPDVCTRLEHAPCITVGSIRGRARGVGSEFLLALDMRFASREKAVLCQPEMGFAFVPGGGGLERLPLVTGRSRAMEIVVGADDFDADTAERYGWINRALPDAELDAFVDHFARRVACFDRTALITAKDILNQRGQLAEGRDQLETNQRFLTLIRGTEAQHRIATLVEAGLQQRTELEMDLGKRITELQ